MNKFLLESAYNVLKNGLQIKREEEVLIVADDKQEPSLADAFFIAGSLLGAKVGKIIYPAVPTQNAEPMPFVAASLQSVQAAVILPKVSITHVEAIRQARKQGTRVLVCSGLDERMMTGAVNADYEKLSELTNKFVKLFESADRVRVTCANGTDVEFSVQGRQTMAVDGICNQPGQWNFAPAGTTATAPLEGTTNGTIVFDGSLAPFGIVDQPVVLRVEKGLIREITGGRTAQEFAALLASFENENVYNIAEMGIGTNEKAELSGKLIEDERILGAFHFGIGKSLNIGGNVDAPFHTDGMIMKPTVYVDGQVVVEDGKILL
ncbi:aminopeptidase [Brevibacillus sp. H7]|jgi:leucyl aminopeptidase (aminopeptidase T)|uniref:aminopeptidase n=1 Tax=Brevibacillus sp. H7 TaxID=3349138 RepID=UPI0037FD9538